MPPPNQRFKDVLLALYTKGPDPSGLGRLQLQKFIYLADIFCAVWRTIAKPAGFHPYDQGPYDKQIQNAADALVFRGFVELLDLEVRGKFLRSQYRLTPAGLLAVESLIKDSCIFDEMRLFQEISAEVSRRGWNRIRELVYSEPTYCAAHASADPSPLRTNNPLRNQTLQLAQLFETSWQSDGSHLDPILFVQIMFLVFDEHLGNAPPAVPEKI